MTPSEPVGHLKSARRQNTWSKLPHAESIESLQVPSQGIKSGFCIVGFLSQFLVTLAVYWIKVETPNVQKSQTRWLGRGILFYGKRNWVGWVDKNLSQNICKFHQTCHKSLLCRGVAVATGSSFFHWTNVPCVESRPKKQATFCTGQPGVSETGSSQGNSRPSWNKLSGWVFTGFASFCFSSAGLGNEGAPPRSALKLILFYFLNQDNC